MGECSTECSDECLGEVNRSRFPWRSGLLGDRSVWAIRGVVWAGQIVEAGLGEPEVVLVEVFDSINPAVRRDCRDRDRAPLISAALQARPEQVEDGQGRPTVDGHDPGDQHAVRGELELRAVVIDSALAMEGAEAELTMIHRDEIRVVDGFDGRQVVLEESDVVGAAERVEVLPPAVGGRG